MRAIPIRFAALRAAIVAAAVVVQLGCTVTSPARYQRLESDLERTATPTFERAGELPLAGHTVLSRDAYVRALLKRNPGIEAARQAFRAALQRYPQVSAFDDPVVGLGAAPLSFGAGDVDDAWVLDVSQKIPFPGKLALRGEAALAEAEASRGDFEAVRLRLATMGSMLFDDYYYAARALEINAQHLELLESFQHIALRRYEAGKATQQDPLQAETELARLLQRDLEIATRLRVTRQQLNALLHRPVDAPLPPAPRVLEPPRLPFEATEATSLAEAAMTARPELGAATARVRAREAEVGSAQRAYFPDLTLVGNYNRRLPISENRPFVGIRFDVPLQLGRRRAAVEEARARLASAESRRERTADRIELAVHQSVAEYERATAVADLFGARLLPAARDRVAAARAGFETGRNSFLELIDAERELRNVELDHEAARADVSRRAAQLLRSVGETPGVVGGAS